MSVYTLVRIRSGRFSNSGEVVMLTKKFFTASHLARAAADSFPRDRITPRLIHYVTSAVQKNCSMRSETWAG